MKKAIILPVLVLLIASMACSFSMDLPKIQSKTIPVETFQVDVPAPAGSAAASLNISMGAGRLDITPDSKGLVTGTVRYNIADWKPEVRQSGSQTTVSQSQVKSLSINTDIVNEWKLALNPAVTYDLSIEAGAYESRVNLSGLSLSSVQISDGASKADVSFDSPNPAAMDLFSYKTGASEVTLTGLANANFSQMTFECGAGNYTLDFGGTLQRDASVSITGGVSQITIVVPAGTNAVVETEGALNNVDVSSGWSGGGGRFQTSGTGPQLTIKVDMGVGNLVLRSE